MESNVVCSVKQVQSGKTKQPRREKLPAKEILKSGSPEQHSHCCQNLFGNVFWKFLPIIYGARPKLSDPGGFLNVVNVRVRREIGGRDERMKSVGTLAPPEIFLYINVNHRGWIPAGLRPGRLSSLPLLLLLLLLLFLVLQQLPLSFSLSFLYSLIRPSVFLAALDGPGCQNL